MPSMKEKRDASASCVVGNCVIVLGGGETSTAPTDSVEILDMEKMEWKEMTKMRSKRFGCSAAAVGNKIVVIGGRGEDGKHLETVECIQIPLQDGGSGGGANVGLGSFLDQQKDAQPPTDANGDMKSIAETLNTMVEHDRGRIKSNYDASKKQAQEMVSQLNQLHVRLIFIFSHPIIINSLFFSLIELSYRLKSAYKSLKRKRSEYRSTSKRHEGTERRLFKRPIGSEKRHWRPWIKGRRPKCPYQ
jgi:hypothetical protein